MCRLARTLLDRVQKKVEDGGGGKAARRAAGAENEKKKMKNTRSFWEHKHGDKKKTQHQTLKRKHGNDRAEG